ncbi:MAG TPA: hypothetical protein VE869_18420 [Gemmatimonas sp.]|nr:hypothetical protein [Gemmatimonas sp.]
MSVLWTPAEERGRRLKGWYDFSRVHLGEPDLTDGPYRVQGFRGLAGNGVDLGSGQPAPTRRPANGGARINGKPALYIDGAFNESINDDGTPNPYNTFTPRGFSMTVVFRAGAWVNGLAGDGSGTYIMDRQGSGSESRLMSLKAVSNVWTFQTRDDSGTSGVTGASVVAATAGRVEIIRVNYSNAAGLYQAFSRGERMFSIAPIGDISLDAIRFGYPNGAGGGNFALAEWVLVNDGLDNRLSERIDGYLAHKWGVPLVGSHPNAARPPLARARLDVIGAVPALYPYVTLRLTARRVLL